MWGIILAMAVGGLIMGIVIVCSDYFVLSEPPAQTQKGERVSYIMEEM